MRAGKRLSLTWAVVITITVIVVIVAGVMSARHRPLALGFAGLVSGTPDRGTAETADHVITARR